MKYGGWWYLDKQVMWIGCLTNRVHIVEISDRIGPRGRVEAGWRQDGAGSRIGFIREKRERESEIEMICVL
jgi:hypothetical protein